MREDTPREGPLRVDVPVLEPDQLFLARLAHLAAAANEADRVADPAATTGARTARARSLRIGLAAAAVAVVAAGGALLAGSLGHDPVPSAPVGRPSAPAPGTTYTTPTQPPVPQPSTQDLSTTPIPVPAATGSSPLSTGSAAAESAGSDLTSASAAGR